LQFEVSRGKQFESPYLEKTQHKKRVGGVVQGVGPEFKPQYHKKKKEKRKKELHVGYLGLTGHYHDLLVII
jgi:hypothetical protein